MLFGEYFHQCDQKYRMRIPSKLRSELGEGCYITKGNDGCLFVFTKEEVDNILNNKIDQLPIFDQKVNRALRVLFSSAYKVVEDNQGRFLLPQALREYAGIEKDVVFVGVGKRAELWSVDRWKTYIAQSDADIDNVLEELGNYGI